jgi:hypothetical protein
MSSYSPKRSCMAKQKFKNTYSDGEGCPLLNTLQCPRSVSQDAPGTSLGHGPKEDHDDDDKLHPQPNLKHHLHCPTLLRLRNLGGGGALQQRRIIGPDKNEILLLCLNGCLGDGGLGRRRWTLERIISGLGSIKAGQSSDRRGVVKAPVRPVVRPCAYGFRQALPVGGLE